eukprot:SAG11_NODE_524_length_8751_cov_4.292765_12_plen_73_part_00
MAPFVLNEMGYAAFKIVGTSSELVQLYGRFLMAWTLLRLDFVLVPPASRLQICNESTLPLRNHYRTAWRRPC